MFKIRQSLRKNLRINKKTFKLQTVVPDNPICSNYDTMPGLLDLLSK